MDRRRPAPLTAFAGGPPAEEEEEQRRRKKRTGRRPSGAARKAAKKAAAAQAPALRPTSKARAGPLAKASARLGRASLDTGRARASPRKAIGAAPPRAPSPARPLLLTAGGEDRCDLCHQEFTHSFPLAVAPGYCSPARAELELCTGCVPVVELIESIQEGSEEVRGFVRSTTGELNYHIAAAALRPDLRLPQDSAIRLERVPRGTAGHREGPHA